MDKIMAMNDTDMDMPGDQDADQEQESGDIEIALIVKTDGSFEVSDPHPCDGDEDDQGTPCGSIGEAFKLMLQKVKESQSGGADEQMQAGFDSVRSGT